MESEPTTHWKQFATEKEPEDLSWSHFFLIRSFCTNFFVIILRDIIVLENFLLSFGQSSSKITMCNLHWCYTFCTGVTLFALVLHLNCTALSQSESSNFFMYIIMKETRNQVSDSFGFNNPVDSPWSERSSIDVFSKETLKLADSFLI